MPTHTHTVLPHSCFFSFYGHIMFPHVLFVPFLHEGRIKTASVHVKICKEREIVVRNEVRKNSSKTCIQIIKSFYNIHIYTIHMFVRECVSFNEPFQYVTISMTRVEPPPTPIKMRVKKNKKEHSVVSIIEHLHGCVTLPCGSSRRAIVVDERREWRGFAWAVTLQLQLPLPPPKKINTHKKIKTRLSTKVNLIKDGKYERLRFPTHAINARLYLILTKKPKPYLSISL